ncbi:hypothetical protein ALC53_06730 [Atta colombica]|uniref:Uncharacterized protein n=1 Tax=Atta colombica TaxID=520822 RepID=A0A151I3B6_9HYME|nr:hypothetical protein ALC53_06730 [Atta colombica]
MFNTNKQRIFSQSKFCCLIQFCDFFLRIFKNNIITLSIQFVTLQDCHKTGNQIRMDLENLSKHVCYES